MRGPWAREGAARAARTSWRRRTARSWTSSSPRTSRARRIRFMAKQELFEKPFLAWLFTALGGFSVDRGAPTARASRVGTGSARRRRAGGDLPGGHAAARARDRRASSTAAPTSRPSSASRSCPSGIGGSEQILASRQDAAAAAQGGDRRRRSHPAARSRRRAASGRQEVTQRHGEAPAWSCRRCFDEALALAGVPYDAPAPPSAGEVGEHAVTRRSRGRR